MFHLDHHHDADFHFIFQWNDFLTLVKVELQHNFEPNICFTFKYFFKK